MQHGLIEKALAFAELGRPIEWSKTLLNMLIATMTAYYVLFASIDFLVFVWGFFSVAFLWGGLYALNDCTDWEIDARHEVKKKRPIPSRKVSPRQGLGFSLLLLLVSFSMAFLLRNLLLVVCLLVMVLNQWLYTKKPFRLKSRKYLDVISGSIVNPIFRYGSGMVLFVPFTILVQNITPILPLVFVIGLQFGGYSLYRLFSKKHDVEVQMKSSVATIKENKIKSLSYAAIAAAIAAYLLMLVNGFTLKLSWLGFLPAQFLIAVLAVAPFLPMLKNAITNPQKADMRTTYRALYFMNLAFIIGNAAVFVFWP